MKTLTGKTIHATSALYGRLQIYLLGRSPARLFRVFCLAVVFFVGVQIANQRKLSVLFSPSHSSTTLGSGSLQQDSPLILSRREKRPKLRRTVNASSQTEYHVVFSTSCNDQQDWESMVFFYHAYKVKQPGRVTRIISGCNVRQQKKQVDFFLEHIQPMSKNFFVHFTPDFANLRKVGGPYKYLNKPFGLKHWMENGYLKMPNSKREDGIVILMDPDMILLRPITHDFSDHENHLWVEETPRTRVVKHGFPMAQQDGYLNNAWMKLNMTQIVGTKEHPPLPSRKEGPLHWNTGPPYLATVRDMYQIALKWSNYTPRVLDQLDHIFSEMYGFIFATIQLQLPFTMVRSLVVSVTTTMDREGWPFVDSLRDDQVCDPPKSGFKLPVVLHYCEIYAYGPMFFSKYRVRKNIMDCDKSLLESPPLLFSGHYNYSVKPPDVNGGGDTIPKPFLSERVAKREAFIICGLTNSVNEALIHHKQMACPMGSANLEKNYSVYKYPGKY